MHHTIAWTASTAQAVEVDTVPLADPVIPVTAANHFLPQRDAKLLYIGAASANMQRARFSSPSLALVTTPFIRPISGAVGFGVPQRFQDYTYDPIVIRGLEELVLFTFHAGAAAEQVYGIAGIDYGQEPAPVGNPYTLRGTSAGPAVANVWTQIAMTWFNQLPTGLYACIGLEAFSATNIATRLIFENQVPRPGALGIQALGNYDDEIFRFGELGIWGRFHNYVMPLVEVLCNAADASFEIYLDIVRIQ